MIVLVIGNGTCEGLGPWESHVRQACFVVAADGGARCARALGLVPNAVIGDTDSLDEETARWLQEQGAVMVRHPPAKDETDLELALLYALDSGAEEILVLGAWGGRPDQSIANLHLLAHPRLAGRTVRLLGPTYQLLLLRGGEGRTISGKVGDTVSLLPLAGDARGIRTTGLRWGLDGDTLTFGPARGISNEMVAPQAHVSLAEGMLLVVHLLRREKA